MYAPYEGHSKAAIRPRRRGKEAPLLSDMPERVERAGGGGQGQGGAKRHGKYSSSRHLGTRAAWLQGSLCWHACSSITPSPRRPTLAATHALPAPPTTCAAAALSTRSRAARGGGLGTTRCTAVVHRHRRDHDTQVWWILGKNDIALGIPPKRRAGMRSRPCCCRRASPSPHAFAAREAPSVLPVRQSGRCTVSPRGELFPSLPALCHTSAAGSMAGRTTTHEGSFRTWLGLGRRACRGHLLRSTVGGRRGTGRYAGSKTPGSCADLLRPGPRYADPWRLHPPGGWGRCEGRRKRPTCLGKTARTIIASSTGTLTTLEPPIAGKAHLGSKLESAAPDSLRPERSRTDVSICLRSTPTPSAYDLPNGSWAETP